MTVNLIHCECVLRLFAAPQLYTGIYRPSPLTSQICWAFIIVVSCKFVNFVILRKSSCERNNLCIRFTVYRWPATFTCAMTCSAVLRAEICRLISQFDNSVAMCQCPLVDVSSPGHSVSVFAHLSTLAIAGSVLVQGVDTTWASQSTFTRLCQVQLILRYTWLNKPSTTSAIVHCGTAWSVAFLSFSL